MKINDMYGLLEELDQTANGPEIDQAAGELDNEATVEKEPETKDITVDNKDVYGEDDQTTEEVKELNITEGMSDFEIYKELDRCGYATTRKNLELIREELDQLANGPEIDQPAGELKNEATEEGEGETADITVDNKDVYGEDDQTTEEVEEILVKEELDQTANGPELDQAAGELKNEATEEGEGDTKDVSVDNKDVYGEDDKTTEEVEEVEIAEALDFVNNLDESEIKSSLLEAIETYIAIDTMDDNEYYDLLESLSFDEFQGLTLLFNEDFANYIDETSKRCQILTESNQEADFLTIFGTVLTEQSDNLLESKKAGAIATGAGAGAGLAARGILGAKVGKAAAKATVGSKILKGIGIATKSGWLPAAAAGAAVGGAIYGGYRLKKYIDKKRAATKAYKEKTGYEGGRQDVIDKASRNTKFYNSYAKSIKRGKDESDEDYKKRVNSRMNDDLKYYSMDRKDRKGTIKDQKKMLKATGQYNKEAWKNEKKGYKNSIKMAKIMRRQAERAEKYEKREADLKAAADAKAAESKAQKDQEAENKKYAEEYGKNADKVQKAVAKDAEIKKAQRQQANTDATLNTLSPEARGGNPKVTKKDSSKEESIKEAYTDAELLRILKESGYKATIKNLEILKEEWDKLSEEDLTEPSPEVPAETANEPVDPAPTVDTVADDNTETATPIEDVIDSEVTAAIENPDAIDAEISNKVASITESLKALREELDQLANGPELDQPAGELKNEATEEGEGETKAPEADNKDVYGEDDKTTEDVEENPNKEEVQGIKEELDQTANGPEVTQTEGELDNEATVEKEPTTAAPDTTNTDVYCDCCHKQVEDVVEVVIEAASICKSKGIPCTTANLSECVRGLLEADEVALIGEPAEKEFSADAAVEAARTGEDYEDVHKEEIQDQEKLTPTVTTESVKYTSLKEACMLDEDYFNTDSYTVQTAEFKQNKLVEQMALLIARENNDAVYNELLKESIQCNRLQEALVKKYFTEACGKANLITKKNKNNK